MTRRLRIFLRLDANDRARVVLAAFLLAATWAGIGLLPFRWMHWMVQRQGNRRRLVASDCASVERVVWAVETAGRFVPWKATCLTQAIAAQLLLRRNGNHSTLCIGVAKDPRGRLQAHAWLKTNGRTVIGDHGDLSQFTPLSPLKADAR